MRADDSASHSACQVVLLYVHAERFGHLGTCIEPDWQSFSKSGAAASTDLIKLAEWLGCRDQPHALPLATEVCLGRGAPAVLAALEAAGGACALARADAAAATCLCHSLMQGHGNLRLQMELAFAPLAPEILQATAADLRNRNPGSPQRAGVAVCLTGSFLQTYSGTNDKQQQRSQVAPMIDPVVQVGQHILTLQVIILQCPIIIAA